MNVLLYSSVDQAIQRTAGVQSASGEGRHIASICFLPSQGMWDPTPSLICILIAHVMRDQ